jgi:hypothetical protein
MPIRRLLRFGRAGVFAAVCVALAAAGHTLVSSTAVAPGALLAGFAGVAAFAMLLAGHERSLPTILGGLLGGQFMLHVLFSAAAPASMASMHPGHAPLVTRATGYNSLGMMLAHYSAALVAAWWLRRGERAVWTLTRQVAALAGRPARGLLAAARTTTVTGPVRVPVPVMDVVRPAGHVLRHAVLRRGPPIRSRALSLG